MIDIQTAVDLQTETVARWHQVPLDNPYQADPFLDTVCQQHQFNFLLWHEEDIARSPEVSDAEIARVKRSIDRYNQQRNDWIERVDDLISKLIGENHVTVDSDVPINTETPGFAIDRLSILALRIFHLGEQLERTDVDDAHIESVQRKRSICLLQQDELKAALQQLIDDIFSGKKRHRTYRQFKMYNDPALNPYLYCSKQVATS